MPYQSDAGWLVQTKARFVLLLVLPAVLAAGASVGALPKLLVCEAAGQLSIGPSPTHPRDDVVGIHAVGSCIGDFAGPYSLVVDGTGEGLLLEDCVFAGLAVIDTTETLTNTRTGQVQVFQRIWGLLSTADGTLMVGEIDRNVPAPQIPEDTDGVAVVVSRLLSLIRCPLELPQSDSAIFRMVYTG